MQRTQTSKGEDRIRPVLSPLLSKSPHNPYAMNHNRTLTGYESPAVEVTKVTVECGFAASVEVDGIGIAQPGFDTDSESLFE